MHSRDRSSESTGASKKRRITRRTWPQLISRSSKNTNSLYPAYCYSVYGIRLWSEIPLPLPHNPEAGLGDIEICTASAEWFAHATRDAEITPSASSWYEYASLRDRSSYARWKAVGEFLVSADGKKITCRQSDQGATESFFVYLFGQALSFALVKQGFEPLHATTVVVNNGAVVFLGDSGFGKSTLAACFLAGGYRLLTDDLLILRQSSQKTMCCSGPNRIKLFPRIARKFLGEAASGVRMNPFTRKMILPLTGEYVCDSPVPIRAIYTIAPPAQLSRNGQILLEPLSPREAFLELVKNTFNSQVTNAERLERQFIESMGLVRAATVRKLSYPRNLDRLPAVRAAILSELDVRKTQNA